MATYLGFFGPTNVALFSLSSYDLDEFRRGIECLIEREPAGTTNLDKLQALRQDIQSGMAMFERANRANENKGQPAGSGRDPHQAVSSGLRDMTVCGDPLADDMGGPAERVHDWRNYIPEELRSNWKDLSPETRLATALVAAHMADREEWD